MLGVGFGWNTDELTDHGVPAGRRRTVLREYLEAMQALWTQDEASYDGEFVRFGGSWAWPKPAQPRVPVILGAGGTPKTFAWIARSGDGWLTTPGETDLDAKIAHAARGPGARPGGTASRRCTCWPASPIRPCSPRWRELGVTDVAFGMPDRTEDEVVAYLGRLAGKLGVTPVPAA